MTELWRSIVASVTRMYPLYSGSGTIANHRLMKLFAPNSPDVVWAKAAGGEVLVPLDDFGGRSVFYFGDVDPKITWIFKQLIKPGDNVLDIGANLGYTTLVMSRLAGPQGTVHAFEANPIVSRFLESTLARNGATNVILHSFALGGSSGEMNLHVPKGHFGAGSLARRSAQAADVHTIPVRKLDDVFADERGSNIALMKMDVEGFELEVLRGSQGILEKRRPAAILFESNELNGSHSQITPVMKFLHDLDYKFVMVPRCLVRMNTQVVDLDRPEKITGRDLVAAPKGGAFDRLCDSLNATRAFSAAMNDRGA